MTGFVRVDPEGFRTDASLAKWIERGIKAGAAAEPRAAAHRIPFAMAAVLVEGLLAHRGHGQRKLGR